MKRHGEQEESISQENRKKHRSTLQQDVHSSPAAGSSKLLIHAQEKISAWREPKAEYCLRWLSSFLKGLWQKIKGSFLYSEKHPENNEQVCFFFFLMSCSMDPNDQPLCRVLRLITSQVKALAILLLSELGMHISKERWKNMSMKVSRHYTPATSVRFNLFQVPWPKVMF